MGMHHCLGWVKCPWGADAIPERNTVTFRLDGNLMQMWWGRLFVVVVLFFLEILNTFEDYRKIKANAVQTSDFTASTCCGNSAAVTFGALFRGSFLLRDIIVHSTSSIAPSLQQHITVRLMHFTNYGCAHFERLVRLHPDSGRGIKKWLLL